ncbi:MAG: prepilin-type N-terminal cleavage/methylation domain-containing protein [Opitutaceae bacterium]|jgi:prepilin-type N-terminal cleavage/methylation domain-containing protein/prepilin-type processing-associated H-X9-DG protein|nr:prepilin-type N-terminal cleavage/methylation domain-containing protein [Opitutaceae bacterium]
MKPAKNTAFTLVELLVVIVIIGILAAIIIPTVGKVRETAKAAQCRANLRQLAMGLLLFANDNKNHFPAVQQNNSSSVIKRYAGNIFSLCIADKYLPIDQRLFVCPALPLKRTTVPKEVPLTYFPVTRTLTPPPIFDTSKSEKNRRLDDIKEPSQAAMVACIHPTGSETTTATQWAYPIDSAHSFHSNWAAGDSVNPASKGNHNKTGWNIYAFVDGHVAFVDLKTVVPGQPRHDVFWGWNIDN